MWGAVSSGSAFSTTLWDAWSTAVTWSPVLLGDFNGDGRADAAHYGSNDQWWVGVSGGSSFTSTKWWPSQATAVGVKRLVVRPSTHAGIARGATRR